MSFSSLFKILFSFALGFSLSFGCGTSDEAATGTSDETDGSQNEDDIDLPDANDPDVGQDDADLPDTSEPDVGRDDTDLPNLDEDSGSFVDTGHCEEGAEFQLERECLEGPVELVTCVCEQGAFVCEEPNCPTTTCVSDLQCEPTQYCDPCGIELCLECETPVCEAACLPHECETQAEPLCNMIRPTCDEGMVSIIQNDCWECVSIATCELPIASCDEVGGFCSVGVAGCPDDTHINSNATCLSMGDCCMPELGRTCDEVQGHCMPESGVCEHGFEAIRTSCGSGATCCAPVSSCNDGSELSCYGSPPFCDAPSIPALIDGCWECVDERTCEPAVTLCEDIGGECVGGVAGCPDGTVSTNEGICHILGDCCIAEQTICDQAFGHCMPEDGQCEPGFEPIRASCNSGEATCCTPMTACDDGTELRCDDEVPHCGPEAMPTIQDGCWTCVNAQTCLPWGVPGCENNNDCDEGEHCDACGTSSCPFCDDCLFACVPNQNPIENWRGSWNTESVDGNLSMDLLHEDHMIQGSAHWSGNPCIAEASLWGEVDENGRVNFLFLDPEMPLIKMMTLNPRATVAELQEFDQEHIIKAEGTLLDGRLNMDFVVVEWDFCDGATGSLSLILSD